MDESRKWFSDAFRDSEREPTFSKGPDGKIRLQMIVRESEWDDHGDYVLWFLQEQPLAAEFHADSDVLVFRFTGDGNITVIEMMEKLTAIAEEQ